MSTNGIVGSLFATTLRSMGRRGESAYGNVDGEEVVDIPAQACRGRVGSLGKTFSGYYNLRTGEMRFDCAEELAFYLEVDLSKVSGLDAQLESGGEEVVAIPAQACRGRAGSLGRTFSGYVNLLTGEMRFDCVEELPFYLEVNLNLVPAFDAQPSGPAGRAAVLHAEELARSMN